MTFKPPHKNWQSSVTKFSMCVFSLADTVDMAYHGRAFLFGCLLIILSVRGGFFLVVFSYWLSLRDGSSWLSLATVYHRGVGLFVHVFGYCLSIRGGSL